MKIIFGNLKMNFLYRDFQRYLDDLKARVINEAPRARLGLAVPYIYLKEAADSLGTSVTVLAQDLHQSDFGPFTSSISAPQLASINVGATLIGHSECRQMDQNSLIITNKVRSCVKNNIEVIYCCGKDPIREISEELGKFSREDMAKIIIAYEPLSAIGSGQPMDAAEASGELEKIRELAVSIWGKTVGEGIKLLYGGSVNLENYKTYLDQRNIDGVLVGGASLKIDDIWKMATLR